MRHTLAEFEFRLNAAQRRPEASELRVLYREKNDQQRRTSARGGLWMAVLVYLAFSVPDLLLVTDVAPHTIVVRFIIAFVVLATIEMQYRNGANSELLDVTCAAALVFGYLGWLAAAITTRYIDNMSYYMVFGAIFMMGANLFFSFRFLLSIVASGIVLAIFLTSLAFFNIGPSYSFPFIIFYISCFVFTSYVNWKLNKERYNVFLNAHEAELQHREASERGKALLVMSNTDPLTGLENRRAIDQRLRDYWDNWQRQGVGFAVLLVDVDFFKKFNDFYGHQEGDACLVKVANALDDAIMPFGATIGRYGGEEFIIVLHMHSAQELAEFADGICQVVRDLSISHNQRRDGVPIVTVSVGAAVTRAQPGAKLEKIINEADRALYSAKAIGRNCYKLFDPNDPQASDESENIAALLKIAIAKDLVSMVYQPIQVLRTGQSDAVEALMRLRMLDGTPVSPSLFIPIAERTGAILELGRWALRTVCRELIADGHVKTVSVNVSPIQLKAPGFAPSVAAILGETGVAGERLAFEITEGLEMEMHSDILRCISDLKALGIKIWLDDFGTGFAGLSWLRLIEFDTVKIDRSFLQDCETPRGRAMMRDIVGLIRNRGHRILVEGVETEDQLNQMREMLIDDVQGFHVGRPAPASQFQRQDIRYYRKSIS
jgi:diguanylate cyclase (GGDEF)-like protein